jgi:hypothetical protein
MNDNKPTNIELIDKGIQFLDDALKHFSEVQDCQQSDAIARVIHGVIAVAQTIAALKIIK